MCRAIFSMRFIVCILLTFRERRDLRIIVSRGPDPIPFDKIKSGSKKFSSTQGWGCLASLVDIFVKLYLGNELKFSKFWCNAETSRGKARIKHGIEQTEKCKSGCNPASDDFARWMSVRNPTSYAHSPVHLHARYCSIQHHAKVLIRWRRAIIRASFNWIACVS